MRENYDQFAKIHLPGNRFVIGSLAILVLGISCTSNEASAPSSDAGSTVNNPEKQVTSMAVSENTTESNEKYSTHVAMATIYWIGEVESAANDYISNVPSAWDTNAVERYGGVDGFHRAFIPKHNSFYFALPATEFDQDGRVPGAREASPWAEEAMSMSIEQSLFKGRWARISSGDYTIFAQWHDVGPNEEQDYGYVFGDNEPRNLFGLGAGIDLSPDAANALEFRDGGKPVTWQFVDKSDVPNGPWRQYPAIDNRIYSE